MKQYLNMVKHVKENGVFVGDRTGTGTQKVFGYQARFDLRKGFPLLTTKKVHLRSIIHELLWFLNGDTNNQYLLDNNVHIWDDWALVDDCKYEVEMTKAERCQLFAEKQGISSHEAAVILTQKDAEYRIKNLDSSISSLGGSLYLDSIGIPSIKTVYRNKKGDLGPIYGAQWRSWKTKDGKVIDQISELITNLKTNPFSRRHVITAWNPDDLPDESISPQQNVLNGKAALASCHCLFQFDVVPLPEEIDGKKYGLNCQLYQRSSDLALGVPFNIASYALLTMMVAKQVNMIPLDFVHTFGNLHIYNNHQEGLDLQLSRTPFELPVMVIADDVPDISSYKPEHFSLVNYLHHDPIKFKIAV